MKYGVRGRTLNVEKSGTGKPALVFLHYWGGSARTWKDVIAELNDRFTTVAYDMRGWGQSDKTSAGYTIADLADEALSLIETLGLENYVLVGHSLGGKIAQLIASRHPEGLEALILVAPAPPTPLQFPEEMRETQIKAYDSRENVLEAIKILSAKAHAPVVVEQIIEDSMSGSREATLAYPTASILEDISSEVSRINVPTLVVAGELDKLDSIEQHKREVVASISNAKLVIVEGSGQLVPVDEPVQLAKEIAAFVLR